MQQELKDIRFDVRVGREKDYAQIKHKNKDLARIITVINEFKKKGIKKEVPKKVSKGKKEKKVVEKKKVKKDTKKEKKNKKVKK